MSTAEKLAMMTPHGLDVDHVPGGVAKLTALDVAGACGMAGLTKGENALLLAMYCGDMEALRQAELTLYLRAVDIAIDRDWKVVRGKEYLRGVCQLAIAEVVGSHRCRACNGTKFNKHHKTCRRCDGSGMEKKPSGRAMAGYIGMPKTTWWATWENRYERVLRELQGWHDSGVRKITASLWGE